MLRPDASRSLRDRLANMALSRPGSKAGVVQIARTKNKAAGMTPAALFRPIYGRDLLEYDLYPAVLRLLHAIGGRNQQVALALGEDRDLALRHAIDDQLLLHRHSAAHRQAHIIGVGAHRIGVAGNG